MNPKYLTNKQKTITLQHTVKINKDDYFYIEIKVHNDKWLNILVRESTEHDVEKIIDFRGTREQYEDMIKQVNDVLQEALKETEEKI